MSALQQMEELERKYERQIEQSTDLSKKLNATQVSYIHCS